MKYNWKVSMDLEKLILMLTESSIFHLLIKIETFNLKAINNVYN